MSFLKASDHKALKWYCDMYNLKIQLSTPPIMYFENAEGKEVKGDLFSIVHLYKGNKAKEPKNKRKVNA